MAEASKRSIVRWGMKSSNCFTSGKCSRCHARTSGNGTSGCMAMSGSGGSAQNAQYQSAYSCTGAKAGTVAMLKWMNIP